MSKKEKKTNSGQKTAVYEKIELMLLSLEAVKQFIKKENFSECAEWLKENQPNLTQLFIEHSEENPVNEKLEKVLNEL